VYDLAVLAKHWTLGSATIVIASASARNSRFRFQLRYALGGRRQQFALPLECRDEGNRFALFAAKRDVSGFQGLRPPGLNRYFCQVYALYAEHYHKTREAIPESDKDETRKGSGSLHYGNGSLLRARICRT
jgi:hypothetical protein